MHYPFGLARRHIDGSDKIPEDIDDFQKRPKHENGTDIASDVDYIDSWRAMEVLLKSDKVRSIGVSNFNSEQIERLDSIATIKAVTNQIESHPNLNQRKFIEFCEAKNIKVTGKIYKITIINL